MNQKSINRSIEQTDFTPSPLFWTPFPPRQCCGLSLQSYNIGWNEGGGGGGGYWGRGGESMSATFAWKLFTLIVISTYSLTSTKPTVCGLKTALLLLNRRWTLSVHFTIESSISNSGSHSTNMRRQLFAFNLPARQGILKLSSYCWAILKGFLSF